MEYLQLWIAIGCVAFAFIIVAASGFFDEILTPKDEEDKPED
jgi:hypothetical protein